MMQRLNDNPFPSSITERYSLRESNASRNSKIFWGTHRTDGSEVAIKLFDPDQCLELEASKWIAMVTSLQHENILGTYEVGSCKNGKMYAITDFIVGQPLSIFIGSPEPPLHQSKIKVLLELGEALHYLHERNIIHRDIHPRNVIWGKDGSVKLIDFELAHPLEADYKPKFSCCGFYPCMAPEVQRGQPASKQSDIFSFSAICLYLISGEYPGDSSIGTTGPVETPNDSRLQSLDALTRQYNPDLARIILEASHSDPNQRIKTIAKLVEALRSASSSCSA